MQVQCECSLPTLSKGSKGDDVKFLQEILNSYGYSLKVDGDFGKLTEAAVKKFQQSRDLTVDGIVGEKTWNALLPDEPSKYPILRRDSTGYYVTLLQDRLNVIGYPLKIDGIFGEKTEAAVKMFQKAQGLVVDGIVGKYTWSELYAIDY
ncbi:peptidoglycan-binding protein [Phormidium sp. LEGE 05292]|uniref:peptidoglycan-binding domain-containing protein n=1 Tax=[Phormidium] sp. LEGE 05292 TaxID=767427 RepID=UPI00187F6521|nr:peptidoglycan-binding protein [Phormidium sp. LEGE 05292]MBE9223884.1 peptidoglycan-binding protein [Phormidium sp. LEGE 05292]